MSDPTRPIGELSPPTPEPAGAREEGFPRVWPLSATWTSRLAQIAATHGLVVHALAWAFHAGQLVGMGTAGPAQICSACRRRAVVADGDRGRCLLCDEVQSSLPERKGL